jgi:hypothetical protein
MNKYHWREHVYEEELVKDMLFDRSERIIDTMWATIKIYSDNSVTYSGMILPETFIAFSKDPSKNRGMDYSEAISIIEECIE